MHQKYTAWLEGYGPPNRYPLEISAIALESISTRNFPTSADTRVSKMFQYVLRDYYPPWGSRRTHLFAIILRITNAWYFVNEYPISESNQVKVSNFWNIIPIAISDLLKIKIILLGEKSWNIFPGFGLEYEFSLYTRSKYSIFRGRISVCWLAGCLLYLGRSFFYLRPRARLPLVYPDDDRHRYACVPSRQKSGISESDFERFVCVEVARRPVPFGAKLLRSERGKLSRRNLVS